MKLMCSDLWMLITSSAILPNFALIYSEFDLKEIQHLFYAVERRVIEKGNVIQSLDQPIIMYPFIYIVTYRCLVIKGSVEITDRQGEQHDWQGERYSTYQTLWEVLLGLVNMNSRSVRQSDRGKWSLGHSSKSSMWYRVNRISLSWRSSNDLWNDWSRQSNSHTPSTSISTSITQSYIKVMILVS